MFEVKLKARILTKNRVLRLWASSLISKISLFLAFLSAVYPTLWFFYPAEEIFPYLEKSLAVAVLVFFSVCSVFFFGFSVMRDFYFKTQLFHLSDKNTVSPKRFYTLSQGVRYFTCHLRVILYKTLWGMLFFSPAVFSVSGIVLSLYSTGRMIKSIFIILVFLSVVLLFVGTVFYVTVTGRYFLCDYLMYISPMQPVKDVVSSSTQCLKGKLISLLFKRISLIPWKLFSLSGVGLPFSSVFVKTVHCVICDELYKNMNEKTRLFSRFYPMLNRKMKTFGRKKKALS